MRCKLKRKRKPCPECGSKCQPRRKYCSEECQLAAEKKRYPPSRYEKQYTLCVICGHPLGTEYKYCSTKCYNRYRGAQNLGSDRTLRRCRYCHRLNCIPSECMDIWARRKSLHMYGHMGRRLKEAWQVGSRRSKCYRNVECRIDKDTFIAWAIPEILQFHHDNPEETPSLDRIDPDGHYELGNIRILSWAENALRSRFFLNRMGLSKDNTPELNLRRLAKAIRFFCIEMTIDKDTLVKALHETWTPS